MASLRMEKVDKHIQRTFGNIIASEARLPANALVTISSVDTDPNLRSSRVWLSVLPVEDGEETLAMVQEQMYELQGSFNRAIHMKPLPRLVLRLDKGAEYAAGIERKFAELASE